MSSKKTIFGRKYGFGKLLLTTKSINPNWKIYSFRNVIPIPYQFIDNVTGNIIKQGVIPSGDTPVTVDLSSSNADTSMYIKVDAIGNGTYYIDMYSSYLEIELTYFDFDLLPQLYYFRLINGLTYQLEAKINNHQAMEQLYPLSKVRFTNDNILNNVPNLRDLYFLYAVDFNGVKLINASQWKNTLRYLIIRSTYSGYTDFELDTHDFSDFPSLQNLFLYSIKTLGSAENVYKVDASKIEGITLQQHKSRIEGLETSTFTSLNSLSLNLTFNSIQYNFTDILTRMPNLGIFEIQQDVNSQGVVNINNLQYLWQINLFKNNNFTDVNITNCPKLKWLYPYYSTAQTITLDAISQSALEKVYMQYASVQELDLSNAVKLTYINYEGSTTRKFNIKNGNNHNLTYFNVHNSGNPICVLVDDITLPIFQNKLNVAGDVLTTYQTVYDNF